MEEHNTRRRVQGDRRAQIAGCGIGSRHGLSLGHAHNDEVTDQHLPRSSPRSPSPSPPTPPSPSPPPHEIEPDCGSAENLAAVWVCHLKCTSDHFNTTTDMYKEPENANCKKECPTLCSPPPSPPLGPPPPLASPPSPSPLCADKMHQQCKIQRCEIYKTSKKQRCKKTCGLCKAAPSAPASASASDDR